MNISIVETANNIALSDTAVNVNVSDVGIRGIDGVGVPSGGASNMVLTKKSGTDYDTQWVDTLESINMNGGYF